MVIIKESELEMAVHAAQKAVGIIKNAIFNKGTAAIVLATGTSQTKFLRELTKSDQVEWNKIVIFHLDEYIGISSDHPASFRKYLKEHFLNVVGEVKAFHLVNGDASDTENERRRISSIIAGYTIDLACVGIGENGHLAFNDPPADFNTDTPYIRVELEERCRQQQVNEGHFPSLEKVPQFAISMSIRQVMKSDNIICFVPDQRKAEAVKKCLEDDISLWNPASILREHPSTSIYLDIESSSLLKAQY